MQNILIFNIVCNTINLIDGKMLDSFSIIRLIGDICDTFGIEIRPKWMRNENFNSVKRIWEMMQKIQEDDE